MSQSEGPVMTAAEKELRRTRARRRFKAAIRFVILNLYWMQDAGEFKISDNVMKNIQLLTRKKVKASSLTLEEKSILNRPKEGRTEEEKQILNRAIGGLKCFRMYPPEVKSQLAAVTYFIYIPPGRTIVKQGHLPFAMYFLLSGEAIATVKRFDKVLNEIVEEEGGVLGPGTMFGEVALIHGIVRIATIATQTPCELLMIKKGDFDLVLRDTVQKAWEDIQKIINKFTYFKNWDSVTKRECSIRAKTRVFVPEETVLGDGVGLPDHVYFVTKGSVCIIEHLHLKVVYENGVKKYRLHERKKNIDLANNSSTILKDSKLHVALSNMESAGGSSMFKKASSEMYFKRPSKSKCTMTWSQDSIGPDVESHFVKVCDMAVGACFSIGENFERRRVVANVPTHCILVPRYWILKNNQDNIWNRVQQFLNQHIPNTDKIFKHFLEEQRFIKYRKSLIREMLSQRKIPNNNTIHNVPYSIRLKEGIDINYDI